MSRLPASPFLYPLTDRTGATASPGDIAAWTLAGGARIVQIRDKQAGDGEFLRESRRAVDVAAQLGGVVFVNDRLDIALLAGAQGIHVGEDDIAPEEVRRLAGDRLLVGVSTHSVESALRAADKPIDYVALGPIFASRTKPGRPPLGLEPIRTVRARIDRPLVVIGGIDESRLDAVVEAGADGIAVVSAVMCAGRVEALTRRLVSRLEVRRGGDDGAGKG